MGEWIECPALNGEGAFAAWLARPQGEATAAIIVVQEIFGVNAGMRRKADDFAAQGYLAIVPDMAWRFAPHFEANPDQPEQLDRAMALRTQLDLDKGIADTEAAIRFLRGEMPRGRKVGVVGFCWGGSIAYLAATRTDTDASVGYYGRQIAEHLREAHAIARPLLLHFGTDDPTIPAEMRRQVHEALDGHAGVTIHDYEGAGHGFAATFGKRRNEEAARLAEGRSETFLAAHLA